MQNEIKYKKSNDLMDCQIYFGKRLVFVFCNNKTKLRIKYLNSSKVKEFRVESS